MLRALFRAFPLALVLLCSPSWAGQTPAEVRAEIDALLTRLQASGCEFNRNGNWYSGTEARTHLLRKLDYLESRTTMHSTEQFIEFAATVSSTTNKAYEVKCGGGTPVPSQQWLTKELGAIRAAGAAKKP